MNTRVLSLLLLPLIFGGVHSVSAQSNDNYPLQGRADFTLTATVASVDADRDRLVVTGDDNRRYTVDTYKSEIALRDSNRSGETGDLVRGMRVSIVGRLLSSDIVAANRVRVLSLAGGGARQTVPVGPRGDRRTFDGRSSDGRRIDLHGTVSSVDERRGRFVVRINNRQRTVFVNDDTDFRNIDFDPDNRVPLRSGDRITVSGALREDGAVDATRVALDRPAPDRDDNPYLSERQITGRVSAKSAPYLSRDIKLRLEGSDREVKIIVPKGIGIRRNGRAVSIHDVGKDALVRITGARDGDSFRASRIEVLGSARDDE